MKSFKVKMNKSGAYFKVQFSVYNSIQKVEFVSQEDATIFQPDSGRSSFPSLDIGKIRAAEFMFCLRDMLSMRNMSQSDITVEEFDAPEQEFVLSDIDKNGIKEAQNILNQFQKSQQ